MTSITLPRFLCGLVTLLLVLHASLTRAVLPSTMGYQAYVTDNTGVPLSGEQMVSFRLYTTETGTSMVWEEVQRLTVKQGLLNAQLGSVAPLNLPDDFDTPLFLGIEIETDGEMIPRQPLTLGGYTIHALNADTLGGSDATAFATSSHLHSAIYYTQSQVDAKFDALDVQNQVDPCENGSAIRVINADGSVVCQSLLPATSPSTITIESTSGDVTILAGATSVTVKPDGTVQIKGQTINLTGNNINMTASNQINMIAGSSRIKMDPTSIDMDSVLTSIDSTASTNIDSGGAMKIESGALMTLKSALIKLN